MSRKMPPLTWLRSFEAAAGGVGIAAARSSLVAGHLAAGRLVRPFDLDIKASEEFYLVAMPGQRSNPARDAFRNWLLNDAAA